MLPAPLRRVVLYVTPLTTFLFVAAAAALALVRLCGARTPPNPPADRHAHWARPGCS
ncbi:hypothetical protein ABII15_14935 [Streptomyces sp. HUAS MG91]|uniref:Uncharacterized protein n=1 Tax=Streptomyces tabacisoli TaxID=3156398 RepID=A0AAU8ISL1_9ACTN